MAATCSLFYGNKIKFGSEFWLDYPIDKPEVPILYKLKLNKRSLKQLFKFIQIPNRKEGLVGESLGETLNLLATRRSN